MPTLKVFEYQTIKAGDELLFYNGNEITSNVLHMKYITALWKMYDEKKRPFFTPTRNGIRFCEWVGVIKVLDLTVEILPKADKTVDFLNVNEQTKWQNILIDMLRICRSLDTPSASDAFLKIKSNSILDLYIERFLTEVDSLIHQGLIKKYKKEEKNSNTLKGKLLIHKHIIKNMVHKERFYIVRTSYDKDHLLHQILLKTIKLLPSICNNQHLLSRCYQLQLNFPEVCDVKVDDGVFKKLGFDRKSILYYSAIQIAKLLLLNYRPDISSGSSRSIAILFDMNKLWEEYIYKMLQKANQGRFIIHNQRSTKFWNSKFTNRYLKPDIVIERRFNENQYEYIVIDTKWKNIFNDVKNISMDDLRQMFAYNHYFKASRCYLLFPGNNNYSDGNFFSNSYFSKSIGDLGEKSCGVIISRAWKENSANGRYLDKEIGGTILKNLKLI